MDKKKPVEKEKESTIGMMLIAIAIVILLLVLSIVFCKTFLDNQQKAIQDNNVESVEKGIIEGNKCVTEISGVDTTNDGFSIQYKMVGSEFNIDCYNELITNLNSHIYFDFMVQSTPYSAYLDWNGKEYYFEKPSQDFVVTENNVGSLIREI